MGVYQLKYRPKKIKELDLQSVRKRLESLLVSKERPQAWLFAGPRGSGKTSAARILSKHLNCLSLKGIEPCGKCGVCQEIELGAGVDVIEMDAASNRGIDDVRSLKENVHLSPISFKYKVFIIDEVHMMTREAFNALLKILEEPPEHVVFVLCTTDPGKIPVTVLSRLTRVDFSKGKKEEVLSSLKKVVKGEGLKVEKGVLEKLSTMVDGSFRDGHKILGVLVSEGGGKVDVKTLEEFLKRSGVDKERVFLDLLVEKKIEESFLVLEEMAELGVDFFEFRQNLLKNLQEELVYRLARIGEGQGLGFKTGEISRLIRCFLEAGELEERTVLSQLPLELTVLKYLDEKNDLRPLPELRRNKPRKKEVPQKKMDFDKKSQITMDVKKIRDLWPKVLLAVRPHNHSVEAFLRASRPKTVAGNRLVLEVFYQFHKDRLEDERNRLVVEKVLTEVLGQEYRIFCELGKAVVVEKKGDLVDSGEMKKNEDGDLYDIAKELFG